MDETAAAVDPAEDDDDAPEKRSFTKELWFLLVVALGLALFMKAFLIQAFFIPSGSMEKTLHGCDGCTGDRVLVNKLVYQVRDIHRGEIVVFNGKGTNFVPETTVTPPRHLLEKIQREVLGAVGFGAAGERDFIKRVIGRPGDVVACCTNNNVTVNGQELHEPYVFFTNPEVPQDEFVPVTVPPGEYFLMGDHRDNSGDSRYAGTVPEEKIIGRAFAVFFPFGRAKTLPVPETFQPKRAAPARDPLGGAAPPALALAAVVPVAVVRLRHRRARGTTD
jgi:signal peptidase I